MDWDRETMATAFLGTGGAWMLGSALLGSRVSRVSDVQRRGLVYAGAGFLLTAVAARWLQPYGSRGVAVSIAGALIAFRGITILLRARDAERARHEAAHRSEPLFDSDQRD
jgi:hypothetical protein